MIKKLSCIIITMIIMIIGIRVMAEGPNISVLIDYDTDTVHITGNNFDGGTKATIVVESPILAIDYMDVIYFTNGRFVQSYKLLSPIFGVYTIKIKDNSDMLPMEYKFEYKNMAARHAGYDYEQIFSKDENVTEPSLLKVNVEPLNFTAGIYRLYITDDDYIVDEKANEFFFWGSDEGTFSDASSDYKSVVFQADYGTDARKVRINVGMGDGLGNAVRGVIEVKGNDKT